MSKSTSTSKDMTQISNRTVQTVNNPTLIASTMPEIVKRTVEQALNLLAVSKAEYVIRLPDGTLLTEGTLQVKATKIKLPTKKRALKMPYGSLRTYVMPYVECLKIGDVAEVGLTPEMVAADVNLHDLLSSVSNAAAKCFGNGSHKVCTNRKTGKVEILRVA